MKKNIKELPIIIGIILIFIGNFLPSIKIASENISFIKDQNSIMIVLAAVMFILLKLEKKEYIIIPSALSISIIIKFLLDNMERLEKITSLYKCYAKYQYGVIVMLLGNIIILAAIYIPYININKIKEKTKQTKEKIIDKYTTLEPKEKTKNIINTIKQKQIDSKLKKRYQEKEKLKIEKTKKQITPELIEKLEKQESKNKITTSTTKDGKISFNKITVKVDKIKEKRTLKEKLNDLVLKLKLKRISSKKLSITKYHEEKVTKKTCYVPRIDIKKWTRNDICCANCGATVSTNSEYCFLCDCKIKLTDKEEKLS